MDANISREKIIKNLPQHMRSLYESKAYYVSLPPGNGANYEESYWNTVVDPDGKERNRLEEKEQFLKDTDYILEYIASQAGGTLLDIGCGLGWLLSALPEKWNKYGIELSKVAAEFARRFGNIFYGPLSESPHPENFFDVVVMHHVIEHLAKPKENTYSWDARF